MARGRKPTPTALKLIKGNPGRRPIKEDEVSLKPAQIPKAPVFIVGTARREWDRVASQLFNCGILTYLDVAVLGAYCASYGIWVDATEVIAKFKQGGSPGNGLLIETSSGTLKQNPLVGIVNKAAADMVRYAAELGMTPSSRVKLVVSNSKPSDSAVDKYLS